MTWAVVEVTSRPNSCFNSAAILVALCFGGGLGLDQDLLGLSDGFLGLGLGEGGGAVAGLGDQALGLLVGLGDRLGGVLFRLGELLLDALELLLALGDASAALLEDLLDRAEGEPLEQEGDDDEADPLGDEQRPLDVEGLLNRSRLVGQAVTSRLGGGGENEKGAEHGGRWWKGVRGRGRGRPEPPPENGVSRGRSR